MTPIGIAWRTGFVRCCSDCFDKPYLIERMKASNNNIVPVVVIDVTTKKAKCYMINSGMTDFDDVTSFEPVLCRKIEGISDYMINKKNIQKSNLTIDEKEIACDYYEKRDYRHSNLSKKDSDGLKKIETKLRS